MLAVASASLAGMTLVISTPAQSAQQSSEQTSAGVIRQALMEDKVAPTINPKGYEVTIVEYLDYQCPFCRASLKPMKQLLARDKKIRVIFRDWPIFGAASERAARLAIASQWQGKHAGFHDALMATPRPLTELKIKAAARKAGVNWPRLERDLKIHTADIETLLARNNQQAEALGLEGTPGFIIGGVLSFGGMDLAAFRKAVKIARQGHGNPKKPVSQLPEGI